MTYDIFFISFKESNADVNWQRLKKLHPNAIRIQGIPSISGAHLKCNELSTTDKFWTVDGDNWVLESLPKEISLDVDLVYFNALDPIDGTTSSAGGVKLWKKNSIINIDMSKGDFCKFATKNSFVVQKTLSEHRYNATPYETWRHSFRHMVKCFSGVIPLDKLEFNVNILERHRYLNIWSYRGYLDAKKYVAKCDGDFKKINLINDYNWLDCYFLESTK